MSLAMLVLLERLNPVERAVFVLRESFDVGFDEIAAIVDRSEDNCRQILTRARRRVAETSRASTPTPSSAARWPPASSPPPARATSKAWSPCSPRTPS